MRLKKSVRKNARKKAADEDDSRRVRLIGHNDIIINISDGTVENKSKGHQKKKKHNTLNTSKNSITICVFRSIETCNKTKRSRINDKTSIFIIDNDDDIPERFVPNLK